MKVLIALMVLALAVPAFGQGMNPDVRGFVTFTPNDYVYCGYPAGGTVTTFYLGFDCFGDGGGLTGVSLTLDVTASGFTAGAASVTIFHPNAQTVIGGPDDVVNGWVIAAPECVYPDGVTGIIMVATIPWYYLGTPGDILILPNPVDGQATVDCNNDLDLFCVLSHGAIGQEPQAPGDPECDCEVSPVQSSTWGSIKSLYK